MKRLFSLRKWAVWPVLAALLLCTAMIAGCGTSTAGVGSGGTGNVAASSLPRNTTPQVTDADLAAVVAGNTAFALNAFTKLDATGGANTVFSPYSVTMAFALLAPGGKGTTLSQIEQAMSFPLPQDRLNPAFNKLDLLLAAEASGATLPDGSIAPRLNNANAVWAQQGFSILPAYLDTLAVNYGTGVHLVDFKYDSEGSRKAINNWVAKQTNNRIRDLVPQGELSTATRLVLTNALWFKAEWASKFPLNNTSNQPFNNRVGSTASVPFMARTFGALPYAQADGCQAVDIPYVGNNLSMMVIMPDSGTFDGFLAALTPTVLADVTGKLAAHDVALSMPKFSFTGSADMKSTLQSLGMTDPFDELLADLSGIDGLPGLYVGNVLHQAFISVDEKGTEAAASTGIIISPPVVTPPPGQVRLVIDQPFIFLIRDRQTGLILFMGKVASLPAG